MLNLYVTSSEKRQGKTLITAGLAATMQSLGYSTCVYKPIQTCGKEINGFVQSPDLTFIKTIDPYINTHFTYLYKSSNEPVIAAEEDNEVIDTDYVCNEYNRITAVTECTIIDGDSGILSPIAPKMTTADLIYQMQIPLLIVTQPNNNAANNTLMTIKTAMENEINVRGVIINNIQKNCSKSLLTSLTRIIEEYTDTKVLGLVPEISKRFSPEDLISITLNGIDIESVFDVKIEKLELN